MFNDHNLDLVNKNADENFVLICQFAQKILNGNEIMP